MYLLSQKTVWIPLYVAVLFTVWKNYTWRGVVALLVMIGIGMLFTDWANSHILRPWIGRLRPSNPDNPIAMMVHIVNNKRGHGYGFPSAHSANMWLLTYMVCHWLRNKGIAIMMVTISAAICYSRVYLGFHYPGDILGGLALATLVALPMIWLHVRKLHFRPITAVIPEVMYAWVPVTVGVTTVICFIIHAALF